MTAASSPVPVGSEQASHLEVLADLRNLPWRQMFFFSGIGLALAVLNHLLHRAGIALDTPNPWFPISVFWARFHGAGTPWVLVTVAFLGIAWARGGRWGPVLTWAWGLALILSANLIQGSPQAAFLDPFSESHPGVFQYYHDAVEIEDGAQWLCSFNENQADFHLHTRTHPPFAVLLHVPGLAWGGVPGLSLGFILAASLTLPLFWGILAQLQVSSPRQSLLVLLLAALPAYNIYSAATLDGVIAAAATLFLLGLMRGLEHGVDGRAFLALGAGFLLTNALTFAGVFLFAVVFLLAFWKKWRKGRWDLVIASGGLLVLAAMAHGAFTLGFGYDHMEAFKTASRLENPAGYLAFVDPLGFLMTRVESICEIALFLSLPTLATLAAREPRGVFSMDLSRSAPAVALAAAGTVAAMLLAGAFRTGETARACLFLIPFLLPLLAKLQVSRLRNLLLLAGLQTAAMQWVGDFFW